MPSIDQDYLLGYNGGLVLKHFSERVAGIQLEFNLSQKGWQENYDTVNFYQRRINYFEIPFFTSFKIGKKNTKFIANVGPHIAYKLSEDVVTDGNENLFAESHHFHDVIRDYEYGISVGLGLAHEFNKNILQLEIRYAQGFNNIFNDFNDYDPHASQNQTLSIGITYLYTVFSYQKTKK